MRYYYSGRSEMIPYEGPPEEAYGRVTNPERFLPLQSAAIEVLDGLEQTFDVRRVEGYGLDAELEGKRGTVRPSIQLTPADPKAAPITVVFTDFPGFQEARRLSFKWQPWPRRQP